MSMQDDTALGYIFAHLNNAMSADEGVPLSSLQGILSQLPPSIRGRFGATTQTIRLVARRFPGTIVVGSDNRVYTSAQARASTKISEVKSPNTTEAPVELSNVTGTVAKVLTLYGFVDVAHPLRACVFFFHKRFFEENRHHDLTKSGIKLGDVALLDAVRSPPGHRATYQATRIKLVRKVAHTSTPARKPAACQPGSDCVTSGYCGTIQAVNPGHAFILFGQDNKDCAYFSIDNVEKSLLQPQESLHDLFSVGDKVHFDAQSNAKSTNCAKKWLATNVKKVQCAELA
ncbi:hypothetical protein HPB49_009708 [Dermacentor silvarum]|uniref:Uncharacterized protein n=1 Tax=Dermacentor silvarum TaxID=543639 RepID=A0ACB8DZ24_DERSI|nr:hypothetical protein HPB49_009708 [Dermacentor silvarum]